MAWFMGKFVENFVSLNTSLLCVGVMFFVSEMTLDTVI